MLKQFSTLRGDYSSITIHYTSCSHPQNMSQQDSVDFFLIGLASPWTHNATLWIPKGSMDPLGNHYPILYPIYSIRLTKHESAIIIQSAWRGYVTRKDEIVQDFRVWQREVKEEKRAANVLIKYLKGWADKKKQCESVAESNENII